MNAALASLPELTGDTQRDVTALYDCVLRMKRELEFLLTHLDSQNVLSAQSVRADNIDTKHAKIKNAQIQSLSADKINTGTLTVSDNMSITNDSSSVTITPDGIEATDALFLLNSNEGGARTIISNEELRIQKNEDGVYRDSFSADSDGNVTLTGVFKTGHDGEAHCVINEDGIAFLDEEGKAQGWSVEPTDLGGHLVFYKNGAKKAEFGITTGSTLSLNMVGTDQQNFELVAGYTANLSAGRFFVDGQVYIDGPVYLSGPLYIDGVEVTPGGGSDIVV